jgi:uncharacterized OB-fold protein
VKLPIFGATGGTGRQCVDQALTQGHHVTAFVLALIEFDGADTLFLGRLLGLDPTAPTLDWIGQRVGLRFRRNSKFKPTDVSFYPLETKEG